MFVGMYLFFVICTSSCTLVVTIIILRMNLHAESKPLVTMPAWVSIYRSCYCKRCIDIFFCSAARLSSQLPTYFRHLDTCCFK